MGGSGRALRSEHYPAQLALRTRLGPTEPGWGCQHVCRNKTAAVGLGSRWCHPLANARGSKWDRPCTRKVHQFLKVESVLLGGSISPSAHSQERKRLLLSLPPFYQVDQSDQKCGRLRRLNQGARRAGMQMITALPGPPSLCAPGAPTAP